MAVAVTLSVLTGASTAWADSCPAYPADGSVALSISTGKTTPGSAYTAKIAVLDPSGKATQGSQPVTVDTGSTGIVISKSKVPASLWASSTKPGQILYTSSGDYLAGKTINTIVQLPTSSASGLKTSPIDIVAASCACKIDKDKTPNGKTPDPDNCQSYDGTKVPDGNPGSSLTACHEAPTSLGMMGVGFARGAHPTTANNPFLNVPGIAHPGYVITQTGISIGLSQANTAGFKTVQLTPAATQPSSGGTVWNAPTVCVTPQPSGSTAGTALCGAMLMDTGIDYMFLTFPQAKWPAGGVARTAAPFDGSVRSIVTPGWQVGVVTEDKTLGYSLTAEQPLAKKASLPSGQTVAVWSDTDGGGFVNTGRRLLYNASYLYDQACGQLGFGPVQSTSRGKAAH